MTTGGISVVLDIWNAFDRTLEIHHETLYNTLTDATFGFSLCVNISVTGLICGKLWWMGRQVVQLGARRSHGYTNVILILVESGALYAANQLAYLIAFMSRTVRTPSFGTLGKRKRGAHTYLAISDHGDRLDGQHQP